MSQHSPYLTPTYTGFIESLYDAAILIEACMQGLLPRVPYRPATSCRGDVAKSGQVFVFEETESGIRRWTDDLRWSPSRVLDGFLVYRQLDEGPKTPKNPRQALRRADRTPRFNEEPRNRLYGSLINSHNFQEGGLMKKSISVRLNNACWRLVSYYSAADVEEHRLLRPFEWPNLSAILPREDLGRELRCWGAPRDSAWTLQDAGNYIDAACLLVGDGRHLHAQEMDVEDVRLCQLGCCQICSAPPLHPRRSQPAIESSQRYCNYLGRDLPHTPNAIADMRAIYLHQRRSEVAEELQEDQAR